MAISAKMTGLTKTAGWSPAGQASLVGEGGHRRRMCCISWGVVQIVSLFMIAVAFIAFALSPSFMMGLITITLVGLFEMVFITTNQTMLQLSIPDEIRGRVTGIVSLRSGLMPVGAFITGIGADLAGPG
ncbi:MAG: hypothetical protein P1S60_16385 [Anaerolineae bacterium]|nr:hypothetical protein [Anaerolineae bacterium]